MVDPDEKAILRIVTHTADHTTTRRSYRRPLRHGNIETRMDFLRTTCADWATSDNSGLTKRPMPRDCGTSFIARWRARRTSILGSCRSQRALRPLQLGYQIATQHAPYLLVAIFYML
jgi:hypothetical protein